MSEQGLIAPTTESNSDIERRAQADAIARVIMKQPSGTPERWKMIRNAWYGVDPDAKQDHADAVYAASQYLKTMEDREFGRTAATRGVAHDEEVNGHIRNSLVAVMPERLKAWLVKYDPYLNVNVNKGKKEQREAWRKVYATFPEYRTTTKQETW